MLPVTLTPLVFGNDHVTVAVLHDVVYVSVFAKLTPEQVHSEYAVNKSKKYNHVTGCLREFDLVYVIVCMCVHV